MLDRTHGTHPKIAPGAKLTATLTGLFTARGDDFETEPVDRLILGFDGIPGDRHSGLTRSSGAREPWYPRGTEMRNERQLSLLSSNELAETAARMGIDHIDPCWIGGNMLIDGIPALSFLPRGTLLFCAGGLTLCVQGQNAPCRYAGRAIAEHNPDRDRLDLAFVREAKRSRGLVAWVEKPGQVTLGAAIQVRLPEQWIYPV
ncbi:MAG: molybdenum cofactor sulfurase [Pseudomonadota bacterium]